MAEIGIDAFEFEPSASFRGDTCQLRLWYSQSFIDSDGAAISWGTATTGFRINVDCTIVSGVVHVPSFTVWSTLDAQSPAPQSIQINAKLYTASGAATNVNPFNQSGAPSQWVVPNPTPATTMTFVQWTIFNQSIVLANPPFATWTSTQIQQYFNTLSPAPNASDITKGITKLSVAPTSAINPIAVGDNDPRVNPDYPLRVTLPYSGSSAGAVNKLLKMSAGVATLTTAGDTGGCLAVGFFPGTNEVDVAVSGYAVCSADNSETAAIGDYVQISASDNGFCHATGSTYPSSGQVIGRVVAILEGSLGIDFFGAEVRATNTAAGAFAFTGIISPTQLSANTDNWNPTGLSNASTIRFSTDAPRSLTGIAGGSAGRLLILQNIGTFPLTLVHDSTSTAANRFLCPNGTNILIPRNGSITLNYDSTSTRWRVSKISSSSPIWLPDYATAGIGTSGSPWTGWDAILPLVTSTSVHAPWGNYAYSSSLNLALSNYQLTGDGAWNTIFQFNGSGVAFNLAALTNVTGLRFENFSIHGNASATKAIYADFIDDSLFRNLELRNVSGTVFENHRIVSNVYDMIQISSNQAPFTTTPVNGLVFGSAVHDAADTINDCEIRSALIDGLSGIGMAFYNCQSMKRTGGTSEGNGAGTFVDQYCVQISLDTVEDESNTGNDITDNGSYTHIDNPNCNGTIGLGATSKYFKLNGGSMNILNIASGVTYPTITGYPRVNLNGAGGITGAGADGFVNFETPAVNASSPFNLLVAYSATTYTNSWVNYDAAAPLLFRRVDSRVIFRGSLKDGTTDTIAFTLPVGMRPGIDNIAFSVPCGTGVGSIVILANGQVFIFVGTGANTKVSFDSVAFDAAG